MEMNFPILYNNDMKIKQSKEIDAFLERCRNNLTNDAKNNFLGMRVTPSTEKSIQRKLHKAGFAEFAGDKETWPSLFLSADEWEHSPYHDAIHLDMVKSNHFSFETGTIKGNELFNVDCIQKDSNRELNDWMKLRAMDRNFEAIYLYQDDQDWMLDAPSEAATNNIPASKAHGKVLTFGLGIGYYMFMALENPDVESITCIEKAPEVIQMFERFLLPQFKDSSKIHIEQGDAYEKWNEDYLSQFDCVYTDIWESSMDGLNIITDLLEKHNPPFEASDFWIEDSCFEVMWTLIWFYFDDLYHNTSKPMNPEYNRYMKKIRHHFNNLDKEITEMDELKFYMYDNKTIREILSGK